MSRIRLPMILVTVLCIAMLIAACGGATPATSSATSGSTSASTSSAANGTSSATAEGTSAVSTPAVSVAETASSSASTSDASEGDVTFTIVPSKSQALYRAREQLAFLTAPSDAVGKTSQVSGGITFNETGAIEQSKSKITVGLSTLQSDKSMRDNYIKQNTLETATYPDAVLVPTAIQGLSWPLPTSGQKTFALVGNLTVHGVTKATTWQGTATFGANQVSGKATTTVTFEDFGMTPPRTMIALSVQDHLTLELDFVMSRGS